MDVLIFLTHVVYYVFLFICIFAIFGPIVLWVFAGQEVKFGHVVLVVFIVIVSFFGAFFTNMYAGPYWT